MKKNLCLIFIVSVFSILAFLHHEQSLALEKKESIDKINSNISVIYQDFEKVISYAHSNLVIMQSFFESDPNLIPEIHDKYFLVLDSISKDIFELEKYSLELQKLCNDLGDYSNKICFVYKDNILEVKENNQMVVKKFNDVILKYNDMSLSNFEVYR